MTSCDFWDRFEEIGRQEMQAAQQRQAREDKARAAVAAFERVGGLTRSIASTLEAGRQNPELDNKPRLQQLRNSLDDAENTISRGRSR